MMHNVPAYKIGRDEAELLNINKTRCCVLYFLHCVYLQVTGKCITDVNPLSYCIMFSTLLFTPPDVC